MGLWNEGLSVPGMFLSPLGDLSHTSILYYRADTIVQGKFSTIS
jgi:hypothetical protein